MICSVPSRKVLDAGLPTGRLVAAGSAGHRQGEPQRLGGLIQRPIGDTAQQELALGQGQIHRPVAGHGGLGDLDDLADGAVAADLLTAPGQGVVTDDLIAEAEGRAGRTVPDEREVTGRRGQLDGVGLGMTGRGPGRCAEPEGGGADQRGGNGDESGSTG